MVKYPNPSCSNRNLSITSLSFWWSQRINPHQSQKRILTNHHQSFQIPLNPTKIYKKENEKNLWIPIIFPIIFPFIFPIYHQEKMGEKSPKSQPFPSFFPTEIQPFEGTSLASARPPLCTHLRQRLRLRCRRCCAAEILRNERMGGWEDEMCIVYRCWYLYNVV